MSEKLTAKNAQTDLQVPIGRHETLVDDPHTRVTRWTFAPGEGTGWHRHELPYLVVPQTTGQLTLHRQDGSVTEVNYEPGGATKWSDVPFEHYAINTGEETVRLLEIEYR